MVVKTTPPDATSKSFFKCAIVRLHRILSEQVSRPGKRPKQLIVQIISVGNDDDRRIVQALDDLPRVEHHGEALSRTLGVPNHTAFSIPSVAAAWMVRSTALLTA